MLPPFRIRNLRSSTNPSGPDFGDDFLSSPVDTADDLVVCHITEPQYDSLIEEHPSAKLTYLDQDDGETITVGSSLELAQRLTEPVETSRKPSSDDAGPLSLDLEHLHIFDTGRSEEALEAWKSVTRQTNTNNGSRGAWKSTPSRKGKERAVDSDFHFPQADWRHSATSTPEGANLTSEGMRFAAEAGANLRSSLKLARTNSDESLASDRTLHQMRWASYASRLASSPLTATLQGPGPTTRDSASLERAPADAAGVTSLIQAYEEHLASLNLGGRDQKVVEGTSSSLPSNSESAATSNDANAVLSHALKALAGGLGLIISELKTSIPEAQEQLRNSSEDISQVLESVVRKAFIEAGNQMGNLAHVAKEASEVTREAAVKTREADLQTVESAFNFLQSAATGATKFGKNVFSVARKIGETSSTRRKDGKGPTKSVELPVSKSSGNELPSTTTEGPPYQKPSSADNVSLAEHITLESTATSAVRAVEETGRVALAAATTEEHDATQTIPSSDQTFEPLIDISDDRAILTDLPTTSAGVLPLQTYERSQLLSASESDDVATPSNRRRALDRKRGKHHKRGNSPYQRRGDYQRGRHSRRSPRRSTGDAPQFASSQLETPNHLNPASVSPTPAFDSSLVDTQPWSKSPPALLPTGSHSNGYWRPYRQYLGSSYNPADSLQNTDERDWNRPSALFKPVSQLDLLGSGHKMVEDQAKSHADEGLDSPMSAPLSGLPTMALEETDSSASRFYKMLDKTSASHRADRIPHAPGAGTISTDSLRSANSQNRSPEATMQAIPSRHVRDRRSQLSLRASAREDLTLRPRSSASPLVHPAVEPVVHQTEREPQGDNLNEHNYIRDLMLLEQQNQRRLLKYRQEAAIEASQKKALHAHREVEKEARDTALDTSSKLPERTHYTGDSQRELMNLAERAKLRLMRDRQDAERQKREGLHATAQRSSVPELVRFPSLSQLDGKFAADRQRRELQSARISQDEAGSRAADLSSNNPFSGSISSLHRANTVGGNASGRASIPGSWPSATNLVAERTKAESSRATQATLIDVVDPQDSPPHADASPAYNASDYGPRVDPSGSNRQMGSESFWEDYRRTPGSFPGNNGIGVNQSRGVAFNQDNAHPVSEQAGSQRQRFWDGTDENIAIERALALSRDEAAGRFGPVHDSAPTRELSKIEKCLDSLRSMGFGQGEDRKIADRLEIYAQAADGSVDKALEIMGEDQKASSQLQEGW